MKKIQWITLVLSILLPAWPVMDSRALAGGFGYSSEMAIDIISDKRGALTKYEAGLGRKNAQRSYVIARDNEGYTIRVFNRSNKRIGLVIAVDGRNIISGRKSYLRPQERMYILGPFQSGEYEGWRTGQNRVNRFYFTGMSDSYAAAWGDYTAMGVIAVAVYTDREQKRFNSLDKRRKTRPMGPRANSLRENPGTGFGEGKWSPSRTVQFSPQQRPIAKEFIKYEWRSTLCKRGIISCRGRNRHHRGNRFWPGPNRDHGFVPFPPLWPFR